jgi:hypothetical protein
MPKNEIKRDFFLRVPEIWHEKSLWGGGGVGKLIKLIFFGGVNVGTHKVDFLIIFKKNMLESYDIGFFFK